ncbi:MlaD family protein [Nocardia sp. NPDC050175]|uniref:MlaD family protein n=1 Tax=Nocardia sp. NPDC050175 TaxID=3364317 RepID=UPI0037A0627E
MKTTRQSLWRMIVVAAVTVVLFVGAVNILRNPVTGETASYTADFTDVSGLQVGSDVRRQGVQIGKVTSIDIRRSGPTNTAAVGFLLQQEHRVTASTKLAVKYQNLSGQRYLDLTATADTGPTVTHVPAAMTTPSFDITTLFHGLEPVLATLKPDDVNKLAASLVALLDGDGAGAADLAAGIRSIADYATDRQRVIATLVANMAQVAETMRGSSERVVEFIESFDLAIDKTMTVLDHFYSTAQYGPAFVGAVNRLLTGIGLREGTDIDALLSTALSSMADAPEVLRLLPQLIAGLEPVTATKTIDTHCGNGPAALPPMVQVLLGGQQVVLCRR